MIKSYVEVSYNTWGAASVWMSQPGGVSALFARITEEGRWRARSDQNHVAHFLEHGQRQIDEIGHALDRYAADTSLNAGVKGLGKELCAGFRRDVAGKRQGIRPQAHVAEEKHCWLAASQERAAASTIPEATAVRSGMGGMRATPLPWFHALSAASSTWRPDRSLCARLRLLLPIGGQAVCNCGRPHQTT
jgi:hypothetical protein